MTPTTLPPAGHTNQEAARRLASDGPNELAVSEPRSVWRLLVGVVTEPMFLLLVACGAIYLVLGDRNEALMLLGFVVVVMAITYFQQRRTQQSLDALREMSSPQALVMRDGRAVRIASRELVVDDIVLLAEGDRVPADMALVESANLMADESLLTGESQPIDKHPTLAQDGALVFSGTLITQGTGRGRVTATGERSALGRIGKSLQSIGTERTPIQKETHTVVRNTAVVGLSLAVLLALAYGFSRGDWLGGLLAGLTLAMAVLPEELPVVLTIFMGLGAWRLAGEKVLARNIPAIELLGATTVLCVDKTGTLTANRMAVCSLWAPEAGQPTYAVNAGSSQPALPEAFHGVLEFAVLASHRQAFDPMEQAIGIAGKTLLAGTEHLHSDWTLVDDYPLSREMLAMSRVWQSPDQRERLIAAKGAPEALVDLCHLDAAHSAAIAAQVAAMAHAGLRVLGVASARFAPADLPDTQHDFDFKFLGLLGLEDPVRPEVPATIAQCHAAGIRVVMITGDHPATASSIARQAGVPANAPPLTGPDLADLDDPALQARLADTSIFCRVSPEQKLRLVQAFRARGDVVAMTGDGVNDAPALKAAHIGVAMGGRGTDVAREAAALVLLNDDFGSLLTAVRYGRRVFANLRKAISFVIAVHVPIVGLSLLPVALGWPLLLMPVHILFLQLIIDPACSVVFEAEPLEDGAMLQPPRSPQARLFDRVVLVRGLWQGGGLLAILVGLYLITSALSDHPDAARTVTFVALALANLGLILCNRSWTLPFWRISLTTNRYALWMVGAVVALLGLIVGVPAVAGLFAFALPPVAVWGALCGAVALSLAWFELVKWGLRARS